MIRIIIPADVLGIPENISYRVLDFLLLGLDILIDLLEEHPSALRVDIVDLIDAVSSEHLPDIKFII